ncbi:MAG TPA: response regulator [Candidatus Sulfotelmatobacter sp.]|nr:response regulator [Candidatus Sulfotelmatobacter sp.]
MARKILLADDSVTAQNMGRKILTDAGYEVITVNNGSAALKKISECKPDLIVLDVYMPGYSGLEVCQRLKENNETARIPVLLTVGKLEPFKPEEARRARAEAFIVKPFEASELLSTLTRLEEKIVPRPEGSKPGRFARANAALDNESRYDKTVANEEDSGWKNRIAFPSRKKEKAVEAEDGDDPAIYNAVNRDLRTTVDRHPDHPPQEAKAHQDKADDGRVDLRALAPEGLPKDVTAEEIAALAAAAAQVKGKFGESAETEAEPTEHKSDAKPEGKEGKEGLPALEPPAEVSAPVMAGATFAEQKSEAAEADDRRVRVEETSLGLAGAQAAPEAASLAATSPGGEMSRAAISEPAPTFADASSGNGSGSHAPAQQPAAEPITMAAAAGAGSAVTAPHWTAVSVDLAPEEASTSLELEMQKAHAAFAAVEAARTGSVVIIPQAPSAPEPAVAERFSAERPSSEASSVESSPAVEAATESIATVIPVPESTAALSAEAGSASESIEAKVKQFESVSASWAITQPPFPAEPAMPASEPPATAVSDIRSQPEVNQQVSQEVSQDIPVANIPFAEATPSTPEIAKEAIPDLPRQEARTEGAVQESNQEAPSPVEAAATVAPETATAPNPSPSEISSASAEDHAAESARPSEMAAASSAAPAPVEETNRTGKRERESDLTDTTAAAWATWRRIRESGDPASAATSAQSGAKSGKNEGAPEDASTPDQVEEVSAMAAAASAEGAAQDAPLDSDSPEIASIVDSVLADLRPKIVAEISKKLGKNKKK